jgi:hypothetical protein
MSDNLTDGAEARALNWLTGNSTTAPTLPLKVRLMTANGSDSTPGTEVVNAGGSTYAAQTVTFGAATGTTQAVNSGDVVFTNMPATTVVGIEIWDSAGTPFRWWWGPANASKTTNLGDTLKILAGALVLTMG